MKEAKDMKENIRVGIAGLGRIGKLHADNILHHIAGVELVSVCSVVDSELDYARTQLGVRNTFRDYDEFIAQSDIDAVAVITSSPMHCEHIEKALNAHKHVFTEKPLGVTLAECKRAERAVENNPDQVFMIGFMRRYDPSYLYAKQKIDAGVIGQPYLVKGVDIDPVSGVEGVLKYSPANGGLFIGMGTHEVDLQRWFLGSRPKSVYAIGGSYGYPAFSEAGDVEVGCALYTFENGAMGMMHAGRTAPYGYHIETEIVGTKGSIRVSPVPSKNLAQIYNQDGVLIECIEDFRTRFASSFLAEMTEFFTCIRENRKPAVSVYDGTEAVAIVEATLKAYKTGSIVQIAYD